MQIDFIKIKRTEDFNQFENEWKHLEKGTDMTAFQSFQWNKLLVNQWFSSFYNKVFSKLYVLRVRQANETVVLFPMIVQNVSAQFRWWGRKKGIYILGKDSYSDYVNFVYNKLTIDVIEEIVKQIKNNFKGFKLYFDGIREDTELVRILMDMDANLYLETSSVFVESQTDKNSYYSSLSKSTRQNLRTSINRMNRDELNYELKIINGKINDDMAKKFVEIHRERTKIKNTGLNESIFHRVSRYFLHMYEMKKEKQYNIVYNSMICNDDSIIAVVYLSNEVAGFLYGLVDENSIRVMQNCFKDEYKFYSPLFYGSFDFISKLCNENKQVDFTRGNEDYKYKLGGKTLTLKYFSI